MNSITSKVLLITTRVLSSWGRRWRFRWRRRDQPRFRVGVYFEGYMINDKNLLDFYHHSQIGTCRDSKPPSIPFTTSTSGRLSGSTGTRRKRRSTRKTDKFRINAASVGLLYRPVRWKRFEPFVGAGLNLYSYKETVEAGSDIPGASGNATGFHVQAGTWSISTSSSGSRRSTATTASRRPWPIPFPTAPRPWTWAAMSSAGES